MNSPHFIGGRYPCRSIAYVPRLLLEEAAQETENLVVLDPFMGSGTTAIEAARVARAVYGVEIDPYARLIASASVRAFGDHSIQRLMSVLECAVAEAPKVDADLSLAPSLRNIDYWFDEGQFLDLLRLKTFLFGLRLSKPEQDLMKAAFGDIIRACSKAERQSLKPYISSKYTKIARPVFSEFHKVASRYVRAVQQNASNRVNEILWAGGDATDFSVETPVDIAITSPPYINAMDYTRCIKLESAWIGTADDETLSVVKAHQLGEFSRRHLQADSDVEALCNEQFRELAVRDNARFRTAVAFFVDMRRNLECVARALRPGGSYYLIIGNSRIRGIEIPTHDLIAKIATQTGFSWSSYFHYRIRDHRTSIPRRDRGGKIEVEHVIGLTAD